jgi:dTMP kinase
MKGFYCLEGIDGCGKSTQINSLIQNLSTKGHVCLKIREPGGTEVGEKIRNILLSPGTNALSNKAELLLYNAARAQLIEQIIQPALALQRVVLADRFAWSTLAYQGYGRQLDIVEIQSIIDLACGDIWPQKTFILDIPVSEFRRRSQAEERNPDRIEQEKEVFLNECGLDTKN